MEQLVINLQLSVNTLSKSFQNIQNIYKNSNSNLNIEPVIINNKCDCNTYIDEKAYNCYKYIDNQIEEYNNKTVNNQLIQNYIDIIDEKIKNLIIDNNEFNNIINQKLNNNIDNDLIIKNNLYITEKLDEYDNRLNDIQFNSSNQLRTDEILKVRDIIHSQNDIYKCINDDIKNIKLDQNLLRDKIIDNWEDIINLTKTLQNQLTENKINIKNEIDLLKDIYNDLKNDYEKLKNDNELLKNDNNKLKNAIKIILDKIDKLKN